MTGYWWMAAGMAIGAAIGVVGARKVKMTAMPQMVALFNGVGGGAAALVSLVGVPPSLAPLPGDVERRARRSRPCSRRSIGSISFAGLADRVREAAGADQRAADHVPGPAGRERGLLRRLRRARHRGRRWRRVSIWLLARRSSSRALFGVLFVLPIGGADMPVVISLLNAFTGLAAAATGFVLHENVLIVSGMLVGASGNAADD